ncbi:FecR family protein [Phenylobacterium deserti]|uniref:Anti-sigma factor n=1 Tax=Phenylobacterium deserti TaxID=1914756 RepID=A0A328ADM1_9CAUL|nr:FecR domain-containing protein [Phenylobacterium deserti]RAK52741.1 anti-sigma factor [Phenylobacterium deserti]
MAHPESSRSIDAAAAVWTARLDRGPLSDEEAEALEAWLTGDPRRRGALLRAQALSLLSEKGQALGSGFDPDAFVAPAVPAPPGPSRRRMLAWGGAGTAAAAAVAALAVGVPAAGAITTEVGEGRRVTLDDGSTVLLNTDTRLRVRYNGRVRRVALDYGEVYVTVVPDPARPFVLDVQGEALRARQAAFRVRRLRGAPVDILVDQGGLLVEGREPVLLKANMRLTAPAGAAAGGRPQTVAPDVVVRQLAWRDGKIAFEGERLDQAAAEFARYSRTRIEILDPELAREPVTGLFAASDPAGFARAVAGVFGAQVTEVRGALVLHRPASPL